jgi:hypothetical protein
MATVTTTPIRTFVSGETVTPAKLNEISTPTISVSSIVNADIDASAAIAASKLALTGAIGATQLGTGAITGQTAIDALANGDTLLIHDDSTSALRKVTWSQIVAAAQPVGSVLKTEYAEILGQTSYSGNNIATNVTSPTTSTGHQLFSIALATSSASNYVLIDANISATSSGGGQVLVMMFAGSTLIAARSLEAGNGFCGSGFRVKHSPASTSSVTYSLRAAARDGYGDLEINRLYTLPSFWNTGKEICSLTIQEIKA